ncbi:MAG TPA: class I SAM-dependent methyltransferase [Longimicrobiaceae bacterium]|nr:class I SAM-dependent methyltransferase [Longimicrobiaceae bacterium]
MSTLPAREAYRLWAPRYEPETAVSFLEDRLVAAVGPPPAGRRLLDAGCGTGRRLRGAGAALAVGVDLTPEMLGGEGSAGLRAAADLRSLPLRDASFDLVWCRLVVGHLPDPSRAYAELARVCRPGGTVVVTDFHPAAVAAGHRRTFRDAAGEVREIEHHVHPVEVQEELAGAVGLRPVACRDGVVGPSVRPFYARAGRLGAYREQRGLPIVLALAFRRGEAPTRRSAPPSPDFGGGRSPRRGAGG